MSWLETWAAIQVIGGMMIFGGLLLTFVVGLTLIWWREK